MLGLKSTARSINGGARRISNFDVELCSPLTKGPVKVEQRRTRRNHHLITQYFIENSNRQAYGLREQRRLRKDLLGEKTLN